MNKYRITSQNSLFLLIDVQTNLAAAMKKDIFENTEKNINIIIQSCKALGIPILITEQYRKGLGPTIASIQDNLGELYKPLEKLSFSCCRESSIQEILNKSNKKYIAIAGVEAHVCVLQTALDLLEEDYFVHVVSDAVCSRFKHDWDRSLIYAQCAGAVVTTTEILIFQLLQKAGTQEFKSVSPLFKNRQH